MTESQEDLSFAEHIRANYKKAVARLDGDILTRFKAIIEDVSSRGASGLHVYYAASYCTNEAVSFLTIALIIMTILLRCILTAQPLILNKSLSS